MATVAVGDPVAARLAAPPRVSLLSTASALAFLEDVGVERLVGVNVDGGVPCVASNAAGLWWSCVGTGGVAPTAVYAGGKKPSARPPAARGFSPFEAMAGIACTAQAARDVGPDSYLGSRAIALLDARLSRMIERELLYGERAASAGFVNDTLKAGAVALNGGNSLGFVTALAELEQGIGDRQDEPGWIHAQRRVVTAWARDGLVTPSASRRYLETAQGNIVIPEDGHDGSPPTASTPVGTPSSSWAYATGPVSIWQGSARTFPMIDVAGAVNDAQVIAERDVRFSFDGCTKVAVKVNLSTALG